MAIRQSIRQRRVRKSLNQMAELPLTSMLDIFVIILVFLLRSYSASTTTFSSPPGIEIPNSASVDIPPDSHHLIITPESVTFEDARVVDFTQTADSVGTDEPKYEFARRDLDEGGLRILPLFDALVKARKQSETLREKSQVRDDTGNPLPFEGVLAIQADKKIDYTILRRVLYTAGAAGYRVFRFLAVRKEV